MLESEGRWATVRSAVFAMKMAQRSRLMRWSSRLYGRVESALTEQPEHSSPLFVPSLHGHRRCSPSIVACGIDDEDAATTASAYEWTPTRSCSSNLDSLCLSVGRRCLFRLFLHQLNLLPLQNQLEVHEEGHNSIAGITAFRTELAGDRPNFDTPAGTSWASDTRELPSRLSVSNAQN